MKRTQPLVTTPWADYALLDSGNGAKRERFGEVILERPETQALWQPTERTWQSDAQFTLSQGKGAWHARKDMPESWDMHAPGGFTLRLRLTNFKHIGVFPEQAQNWAWLAERSRGLSAPKVLNLFGYTGAATLAAAHGGAHVTHVDASKQSLDWAHENAQLSGIPESSIRWICEDALSFVRREGRRGSTYDGIVLDPPAFGRGAKGQVWKIEEDLPKLLEALKPLLAETPGAFFLINGYAAGYGSDAFAQAVESVFGEQAQGESGELHIAEADTQRVVPAGIYARFVRA